ncbi:MAG TPA: ABC transporter ATP-binding protein [Candidatus Dormibacteraeota bacterium]|nr:ABC transporter ATP-binding protein [Candidatus Dormibacteraeota bacterium]
MAEPLLALANVHAYYGSAHVLFDLALEVQAGSLLALVGRNGAGKTTTARTIVGVGVRAAGSIRFDGVELARIPTPLRARRGVQLVPEDRRIYAELTVRENLLLGRHAAPRGGALTIERILSLFPMLEPLLQRGGRELSGGEQQLVAVARALVARPRLLILDEPTEGLAPVIVEQVGEAIRLLRAEFGTTVLLIEQNAAFALDLADHVAVIDQGRIAFSGTRDAFLSDPALAERFLTV